MTSATATSPAINLIAMGIQDIDKSIKAGSVSVAMAFSVVQGRIDKRTALGQKQLAKVVEYRNELASSLNTMGGPSIPSLPVPTFTKAAQANAALPTNPDELADVIVATVGINNIATVIARLTARVMGA